MATNIRVVVFYPDMKTTAQATACKTLFCRTELSTVCEGTIVASCGYLFDPANLAFDYHQRFIEVVHRWAYVTRDQVEVASYTRRLSLDRQVFFTWLQGFQIRIACYFAGRQSGIR